MRYAGESYEVHFISVPELYEVRAYSVPEVRSDPLWTKLRMNDRKKEYVDRVEFVCLMSGVIRPVMGSRDDWAVLSR